MLPYEIDKRFAIAANTPTELPAPGRAALLSMVILGVTNGDKINLYSRKMVDSVAVVNIVNAGNGKCAINLATELMARPGDSITVAGNATAGYNTTHIVTDRRQSDGLQLITDQNWSANGAGGTASTDFSALADCYRIFAEQTAASSKVSFTGDVSYINDDPKYRYGGSTRRRLWITCDNARTIRVVATFRLPETMT